MKKKIKVVLVVEAMLGGIRQHVVDIALGLDQQKYDVYMIYSDNRADEKFKEDLIQLKKNNVHMILCNDMGRELSIKKDIAAIYFVMKEIKKIEPDIVHGHSSKGGIVGRVAGKLCGIKKIYYTPNAYAFQSPEISDKKKKLYVFAERILSKYMTNLTINVSKGEMQKALENNIDKPDKFTLIYNGIPNINLPSKDVIREKEGFQRDSLLIGVTARCAQQKDPMTFLEIAKKVIKIKPGIEFVYIGDGPMEQQMKDWVERNRLDKKIHLLGFRNNASEIVTMLDIYLSTALYEGLPYSMIEAMRAGVPIIATDVVGNNELVVNNENGLLFETKNIEDGSGLIVKQIDNKVIKKENVIKTFEERFSLKTMIEKLNEVYAS